ncbi:MAG: GNAT family N-acetyltransferase [Clostridia bacterium]|nr:GNAT family N-acetyltransferase [Clostridia bacterium]
MAYVGKKIFACSMGTLAIQSAEPRDAEEFLFLVQKIDAETDFLVRAPGEFRMNLNEEAQFIEDKLRSKKDILLTARVNGVLAGTLGFVAGTLSRYNHKGEFGLSVLKDFWGAGIGKRLIETMFEWADANGVIKICLEVDTCNSRAISLYRTMGFVEEGYLRMDRLMETHEFRDTLLMARFNPFYSRSISNYALQARK